MLPTVDFCFKELMNNPKVRKGFIAAALKIRPEEIGKILDSGNRTAAGPTVPPGGLYMTHLWYDDGIEKFQCASR